MDARRLAAIELLEALYDTLLIRLVMGMIFEYAVNVIIRFAPWFTHEDMKQ